MIDGGEHINIVSYGGGANSTALLVGLHQHRIPVDLILFADTGGEHPHTYAYLDIMDRWLKDHGMPEITRVYKTTKDGRRLTLEDECLKSGTLPSIAYGFKRCSLKHKIGPQEKFCNNYPPCRKVWVSGKKVVKFIGYDAGEHYRSDKVLLRDLADPKYSKWYPLMEWGWDREACMHLRRFQLYQLCCPYCGTVSLCIHDKKESKTAGYNFCHSCGRTSTLKNIQKHLARFVRIKRMNRISIQAVAEHRPETEKWLLAYDCYQIEIIELASIIEVLFRDYFEALLFISCESKKDSFLEKIVRKYTGNDFMNIEKTNDIYKKAFGIEIRKNLNAETWDDLLDIVNLRNMIVHNNGQVDKRFESTSTFRRWKDRVDIPLIKIEDEDIAKLLSSVIDAVTIISNLYLKEYYQRRNRVIANYYFNKENAYDFFADTE